MYFIRSIYMVDDPKYGYAAPHPAVPLVRQRHHGYISPIMGRFIHKFPHGNYWTGRHYSLHPYSEFPCVDYPAPAFILKFDSIGEGNEEELGVSSGWARIFHLYGPREAGNRLVSAIIRALLEGKEALCTHGRQYRDFLYVKDVAAALVAMLFSDVQGTVNIGSGKPIQVKELALAVARRFGGGRRIRFGAIPYPEDEPLFIGADIERLQRDVQWKPAYTLEAGIEESIAWWRRVREGTME